MSMLTVLSSKLGRLLTGLVAALVLLIGVFQYGRRSQREDSRVVDLEEYIKTKEEIDDVQASPDTGAALERLRDNGWVR